MKWLAVVLNHEGGSVHCSPHATTAEAEQALIEFRRNTALGFGTQYIIAEVQFAIME